MPWSVVARVTLAFLYGVMLGVMWECASLGVLLLATLLEHFCGTLVMSATFIGTVAFCLSVAASAGLIRPLLSIFAFRISAQITMAIGTGSLVLTTIMSDTPVCTSGRLRARGWRAPVVAVLKVAVPKKWVRRVVGVEPPYGPPFLRILAAVASREWMSWLPTLGLPSLLALPGTITFRPDPVSRREIEAASALSASSVLGSWLPSGSEVTGVYTYACQDVVHSDFLYIFRYSKAYWVRPASSALLQAVGSLLIKMLLMHVYASLFMLLSQTSCREAFAAEMHRRLDRVRRWFRPRPPVRLIPIDAGDLCAFCHEELLRPPPSDDEDEELEMDGRGALSRLKRRFALSSRRLARLAVEAALELALRSQGWFEAHALSPLARWARRWRAAWRARWRGVVEDAGSADDACALADDASGAMGTPEIVPRHIIYCQWGCGKAVHSKCAAAWGRNACVYCSAPMC